MPVVVLVRHALSAWNVEGRWQGQADPSLSPEGEAQARAAQPALGAVDLVVTSDLERARATGELLAPGAPRAVEPGLRELDVGAWSGLTTAEIKEEWPDELARFEAGTLAAPPGGESRAAFDARVMRAAGGVAETVTAAGAERTLVVAHGGVLRALARSQGFANGHVNHLAGFEAEVKGDTLAVRRPVDLRNGAAEGAEAGWGLAL